MTYPSRDCWNFLQAAEACMQGNFFQNLENSDCAQGKNFPAAWKILSACHRTLKKSLQPLKFLKNQQAVFKEVQ